MRCACGYGCGHACGRRCGGSDRRGRRRRRRRGTGVAKVALHMLNSSARVHLGALEIAMLFHFDGELALFESVAGGGILLVSMG